MGRERLQPRRARFDELEQLAPRSDRMDDVMTAYVDRGNLVGGERAVHLLCLGHAQVVQVEGEEKFITHDLGSWIGYSKR